MGTLGFKRFGFAFLILVCLCFEHSASASPDPYEFSGHLRAQGTVTAYDKPHILELVDDTGPFWDGGLDARLNAAGFVGKHLTLEAQCEALYTGGEARRKLHELAEAFPQGAVLLMDPPSDERRLFSLTRIVTDSEDQLLYHRLDRLSAVYTADRVTVRAGRQALTWGNGLVFNPMDLLNPFAPSDVIRDYKIGDDMLVLQGWWGPISDWQLAYAPRRNPETGDVSGSASSAAGKIKWSALESDWDLLLARHYEDAVIGVGMVRYVMDAAWRADLIYTALDGDFAHGYVSAVTNLDYSWVWGGYNFYGLGEIYYNGLGDSDAAQALQDQDLSVRLKRGDLYALGQWYAAAQIQFEIHPLVNLYASAIANLNDSSFLFQPRINYDVLSSASIMAGVDIPTGPSGTEYGGLYDAPTHKPVGAPVKGYLICTWYF